MTLIETNIFNFSEPKIFINGTVEREPEDYIEIVALSITLVLGLVLNTGVFVQLMRQPKWIIRTPTASTSFLAGPYQRSSFALFKKHLCLTDFAILLGHTLGKIIWVCTLNWKMGGVYGCKFYQFLSAFTYYSNSNVVVAIGLDRLKVVYTRATSVRRVRWMLLFAWTLAAICAVPQLYVWDTVELIDGVQCTTIWQVTDYFNQSSPFLDMTQIMYEMSHQAMVFFIPFLTLLSSYVLIVIRILHYTFHPVNTDTHKKNPNARMPVSNISEQRLLSISMNTIPEEYCQFSCENSTELISLGESAPSESPVEKKDSVVIDYLKRVRGTWDCFLGDNVFSERIAEKRKTTCCGSIRACCLAAETTPLNFRPLGIRPPDMKESSGSPVWRRQLKSRIFITSLAIVTTHFILWLPYNLLNITKFMHVQTHSFLTERGANLLEDLIVLNSVLNPILYSYEPK
ncbi:hypothetical protein FO519_003740 [Halicephalobus sp. NKZ332]|nr:hypothetical protein FO519_003740 [Halicephalobus sp. NKZ332]